MDYDKENVPMSVIDSPKRNKGTSKVIDQLHSTIDSMKQELSDVRLQADDYKKKYVSLNKRHDHVVEQLANAKHENDMINALLKRKERRILDLETQFSDSIETTESLKLKNSNLEIRCKNLQDASASSVAEYERLKISYDAIVTSQNEYRNHFNKEVQQIKDNLQNYINERELSLLDTQQKFSSNNQEFDKLFSNLLTKSKNLENIYSTKNNTIVDALKNLAGAAKTHGEETKTILNDCNATLNIVYKYFPEFKKSEPVVSTDDELSKSASPSPDFKLPRVSQFQQQQQNISNNSRPTSRPSSRPASFIATGSNGMKNSTRRKRGGHKRNSSRLENYDYNANMANYNQVQLQQINTPKQPHQPLINSPQSQQFNYSPISNSPNQRSPNQEINVSKRNSIALDNSRKPSNHQRNNSNNLTMNNNIGNNINGNNNNNNNNNSNNNIGNGNYNKADSRKSSYDSTKKLSYQHPNAKKKLSVVSKSRNSSFINPDDLKLDTNLSSSNDESSERESAFQKLQGNINQDKEASDILNSLNETIGE